MLRNQKAVPFFEVIVNGQPLAAYATQVEIVQEIDAHPVAFVQVQYIGQLSAQGAFGIRNSWRYIPERTPIAINYGRKPGYMGQFLGYVGSYKLIKTGTDKGFNNLLTSVVEYTIIGTSQPMQSTVNKAWKNISPSAIASQIAVKNGFRAVIHPYTSAITYRLQNVSDFQFLAKLAQEIGYHFYVDNTDLYFINPKVILDRSNTRNIPQFWAFNRPGLWDTIRDFNPIVGTITPDGGIVANRTITGLNPRTGNLTSAAIQNDLFTSNGSAPIAPTITKYYNRAPAESYFEATQKVQADINKNIYWLTADSELYGDFRVKPNTLVDLVGTAIPATESGIWLVRCVRHCLTMPAPTGNKFDAKYTMYTQLMRDQVYTANTSEPGQTDSVLQTVPPKLLGGVWKSSNVGAQFNVR